MKKYKANILLVEDDENLGFILQDYLDMMGYNVDLQKNGVLGFETYKLRQSEIDLCILDIMMPFKDGFTLAQEIRNIDSEIPIIFLTAKLMKEDRIRGFQLGADDYITKPFSSEELSLRIDVILKRYKRQGIKTEKKNTYNR